MPQLIDIDIILTGIADEAFPIWLSFEFGTLKNVFFIPKGIKILSLISWIYDFLAARESAKPSIPYPIFE
jgi:hypothetical protein